MGKESERAESVVDGDNNDAVPHQLGGVEISSRTDRPTTAMDPHEHRSMPSVTFVAAAASAQPGRVDVEVQAVFVGGTRREHARKLWASGRELGGVADTVPPGRRLGGPPPQVPKGWSGVRQPPEDVTPGHSNTADNSAFDVHDRGAA